MAEGKDFLMRIELDIHSVDYHFKNLSYSRNIALKVHTLSCTAITMPAIPYFPVHFKEKLIFEKVVDGIKSLSEIEENLDYESIKMELVQWPGDFSHRMEVLAHFQMKLTEILFQDFSGKGNLEVPLEPFDKSPGTSGGSVQVSTRIIIAELTSYIPRRSWEQETVACYRFHSCPKAKSQNSCSCVISTGQEKKKFRSKQKNLGKSNNRLPHMEKMICCTNCYICKSYCGYFHREPISYNEYRSCCSRKIREELQMSKLKKNFELVSPLSLSFTENFSTKSRFICNGMKSPIPYRQIFYENLDFSYRTLGDKKCEKCNCPFL